MDKQADLAAGAGSTQKAKRVTGLGVINLAEVLDQTLSGTVLLFVA